MKVIVQRVMKAHCVVDQETVSAIGQGFVLLVGFEQGDQMEQLEWMAQKIAKLRIFEDHQEKMNLDLQQVQGEILSISQFTLAAEVTKGNRPSFVKAMEAQQAQSYFTIFNEKLRSQGLVVKEGVFQAHMEIHLVNDGPVTIIIERE